MPSFEAIDPSILTIDKFIFHIIHQKDIPAILLEETPIGSFHDFFIERVTDTLKGNRFTFAEGSQTESLLKEVLVDKNKFIDCSKQLAINFNSTFNDKIKPGVFILMQLWHGTEAIFSIIKYDHERVLTYKYLPEENKAMLEEVINSFTKSKQSLHKSALIRINDANSEITIIDRTVNYDITQFFKCFLNVVRKYDATELTKTIFDATLEVTKIFKDSLPAEITGNIRALTKEILKHTDTFENPEEFVNKIFGANATDALKNTFQKILEKKDIDGETFKPDISLLPRTQKIKIKTDEGVLIQYNEAQSSLVDITENQEDQTYTISVKTKKYLAT